jgi:hypothetical protein
MQTRYHLATLKKNNLSVTDYFQKAKQYADLLASIGQPLSDSDIITYIFAGLPTEYDSLVTSLNTRLESFSLDDLYGHLLTYELRLEQQTPVPDIGLPVANLAAKSSSSPQPPRQFSNGGRGSHFNGNRGRGRGHSYRGRSNGGSSSSHTSRPFCQICLKIGHTAPACWHRFEQHYQPPNGSSTQAFVATTPTSIDQVWYPDTGANNHMTADFSNLNLNADYYTGQDQVRIGNGQGLHIHHIGSSILYSSTKDFFLKNILHVPHISQNLLSVYQFAKDNKVFFEFHPSFFCIKDQFSGAILLSGKSKDGLYPLHSLHQIKPRAFIGERVSLSQWHACLGHPALRVVRQVLSNHHLAVSTNKSSPICHACQLGKSHRLPFYLSPSRSKFPLELIFTDVWGPAPTLSNNGNRYYVCFIDDFSKFIWLFPFSAKSDVYNIFLKFQVFVERYFNTKIKSIQSDWGGEYRNLNKFFSSLGILHRLSCPHTHQQNGSVERKHRHIVETGLTLLANASVPFSYWDDAFLTSTYLINCLPSPVTHNKSPLEILYHKVPDYNFLKTFGCACWPHLLPYNTHKLDFRSKQCIFLGYSLNHKGYRCLDPITNRIYIARNVIFDETVFPFSMSLSPPHSVTNSHSPVSIPSFKSASPPPINSVKSNPSKSASSSPINSVQHNPSKSASTSPTNSVQHNPSKSASSPLSNSVQSSPINSASPFSPASVQSIPTISASPTFPNSVQPNPMKSASCLPSQISPSLLNTSPIPPNPEKSASPTSSSSAIPLSPQISTSPPTHTDHTQILSSTTPTMLNMQDSCHVAHPTTHPMTTRSQANIFKPKPMFPGIIKYPLPKALLAAQTHGLHEPTCYTEASKSPEWRTAMNQEFTALLKNGTWTLVPPNPHSNVVGCKWVFRIKRKADGSIERYKARLVAKGFHQQHGIDYGDTFSPVIKPITIRTVLSLAVASNWDIRQLDVTNAFLHGVLSEDVYMTQPPGFVHSSYPTHVCHLRKALYGLKQAPRAWYSRLSNRLLNLGFHGCKSDTSLFIYRSGKDLILFLIYVDDIIVTSPNPTSINTLITTFQTDFALKDLGPLHFFLGVEAHKTASGMYLSQRRYISDLLQKTNMHEAKPVSSPMSSSTVLSQHSGTSLSDSSVYRSVVGSLQYLSLTRPDIAFAVNKVCQYMHNPTEDHWSAVKRILRHLKHTIHHCLFLHRETTFTIQAFSDVDWASCPDDRRSTTGYCLYLGRNLLSWTSRKQRTVSRSSTESEYRAVAQAATKIVWLQSLLSELGILPSTPPILWCDNIGATYLAANPIFHARTKHIEIDVHYVRDLVSAKALSIRFVSSKDQIVDTFTKPLPTTKFNFLRDNLNVRELPLGLWGRIGTTTSSGQFDTPKPSDKDKLEEG